MSLQARTRSLAEALARTKALRAQQETALQPSCNRKARRKATSLPGLLTFANMRVTVPCTIADMSGTGARISIAPEIVKQFGDLDHLPSRTTLVMRADRMQVDCEVRWRKPGQLGLRFLAPPRPIAPVLARK